MRVRSSLVVGLALLVSALLPVVAGAGPYKVKNLQAISAGPSLFPAGCPGAFHDSEKPTGLETEPAITVDPANPRNIIRPGSRTCRPLSTLGTTSSPHRSTAARFCKCSTIPGLTRCTGGTSDTASDPWVSAAGDGTVYFGGQLGLDLNLPPPAHCDRREPLGGRRPRLGGADHGCPPSRGQ